MCARGAFVTTSCASAAHRWPCTRWAAFHRFPADGPTAAPPSESADVAHDLRSLLGPEGVMRSFELQHRVDRHSVSRWVARGDLLRPYPGVLVHPDRADEWRTRALAAVYATDGVLSHFSALAVWRVAPQTSPLHVSIPAGRRALRRGGIAVHRVRSLPADRLGPFPVTDLDRALVDSWGLAAGARSPRRSVELARAAVLTALRERRLRPARLRTALAAAPALAGRSSLLELIGLVEQGCHSELEIWGVRKVLEAPGMPGFVQQHEVVLPFGRVRLDAAIPDLKIAIELDGAAFHGSSEDREKDLRRDAALAALGWIVLRFSYRRLTREPDACRREILAVCAMRRAQLSR